MPAKAVGNDRSELSIAMQTNREPVVHLGKDKVDCLAITRVAVEMHSFVVGPAVEDNSLSVIGRKAFDRFEGPVGDLFAEELPAGFLGHAFGMSRKLRHYADRDVDPGDLGKQQCHRTAHGIAKRHYPRRTYHFGHIFDRRHNDVRQARAVQPAAGGVRHKQNVVRAVLRGHLKEFAGWLLGAFVAKSCKAYHQRFVLARQVRQGERWFGGELYQVRVYGMGSAVGRH